MDTEQSTEDLLRDSAESSSSSSDSLLSELAKPPAGGLLARGTVIDEQYRIERVLGEGGMGVVYLARDLRLERDVAIKLGRDHVAGDVGRMAREALSLARLSHPNVVIIYQVGVHDSRAYVAMEHVPGGTARAWCLAPGRSVRDIVELYTAAGDGLAAAHAAGLVHRDIKPDNVLVGTDGRPRVADFGLAREPHETGEPDGIAGTPAYMPPEQKARRTLDVRADQYAFCASLWEALYGARPKPDQGPASSARKVPRHIEAALRRGLAADPDERWPDLAFLVDELRRDPRRAQIVAGIGAGAFVTVAIVAYVLSTSRGEAADPCATAGDELAAVWNQRRLEELRGDLAPPDAPAWRTAISSHALAALDDWAERWRAQSVSVCTAGRGAWSASLHDRAVACLARRRASLAGTLEAMPKSADEQALVDRLPAPESCGDAAYLAAGVAPPDPLQASEANELDAVVAQARNEIVTTRVEAARQALDAVQNRIDALNYAPLAARARLTRALGLHNVGELGPAYGELREAYFAARAAGDFETASEAAADAALVLLDLSRDPEAADWARIATAEANAAAGIASTRLALRATVAVAKQRGELTRALDGAERLVAMESADEHSHLMSMALTERARVLSAMGEEQRAISDFDGAIADLKARGGDFSQQLAGVYGERSMSLSHLHRYVEAETDAREALRIAERTDDKTGEMQGVALSSLGVALQGQRKLDEALATLDRSLALARATEGADYNVASDLNNRADLLAKMGRLEEAIASWEECIALWKKVLGPNGYEVSVAWVNVGNALISVRQEEQAEDPARQAIAILVALGKDAPAFLVAEAHIELGVALVKKSDWKGAREELETGIGLLDPVKADPTWRARGQAALGRVELHAGNTAKGRELLLAARVAYAVSAENAAVIGEIDALLSDRSRMP